MLSVAIGVVFPCISAMQPREQDRRDKPLRIVDVPGHPRISKGIFASHTDRAKGVVFVVDSVDFMMQKDQVGTAASCAQKGLRQEISALFDFYMHVLLLNALMLNLHPIVCRWQNNFMMSLPAKL